ncbi:MAG: protein kinase [Kofleriaceae bacterium]|nr:protein kinase [Kofleriaceae bacterium]
MGDVIGNYEIVAELKRGGMGVVYTARHQTMGQLAVVKKLLPEHTRSHDVVQRFFQEAQAAAALDDPGIVRIFDQGVLADGSAYIVMELLQGESLADRLRRVGRLAPEVAVTFMRQAARAVAKAHGRGIVHRDLKPDNLFIVPDPDVAGGERVKVLDFGIAKLAGDARVKTMTAMPMGTPAYMSPEQWASAGKVDGRTDVYAFGVILFEMLTGRLPFDGPGLTEFIDQHRFTAPPAPSQLDPALAPFDAVVARCLAKAADERFATLDELTRALPGPVASLPASAPPVGLAATLPVGGFAAGSAAAGGFAAGSSAAGGSRGGVVGGAGGYATARRRVRRRTRCRRCTASRGGCSIGAAGAEHARRRGPRRGVPAGPSQPVAVPRPGRRGRGGGRRPGGGAGLGLEAAPPRRRRRRRSRPRGDPAGHRRRVGGGPCARGGAPSRRRRPRRRQPIAVTGSVALSPARAGGPAGGRRRARRRGARRQSRRADARDAPTRSDAPTRKDAPTRATPPTTGPIAPSNRLDEVAPRLLQLPPPACCAWRRPAARDPPAPGPSLPATPSRTDVAAATGSVRGKVERLRRPPPGYPGTDKLLVKVGPDGRVTSATCLRRALRADRDLHRERGAGGAPAGQREGRHVHVPVRGPLTSPLPAEAQPGAIRRTIAAGSTTARARPHPGGGLVDHRSAAAAGLAQAVTGDRGVDGAIARSPAVATARSRAATAAASSPAWRASAASDSASRGAAHGARGRRPCAWRRGRSRPRRRGRACGASPPRPGRRARRDVGPLDAHDPIRRTSERSKRGWLSARRSSACSGCPW